MVDPPTVIRLSCRLQAITHSCDESKESCPPNQNLCLLSFVQLSHCDMSLTKDASHHDTCTRTQTLTGGMLENDSLRHRANGSLFSPQKCFKTIRMEVKRLRLAPAILLLRVLRAERNPPRYKPPLCDSPTFPRVMPPGICDPCWWLSLC